MFHESLLLSVVAAGDLWSVEAVRDSCRKDVVDLIVDLGVPGVEIKSVLSWNYLKKITFNLCILYPEI
jgi:hypothetical protein